MSDDAPLSPDAAVAKLEQDYTTHKASFERWKVENARLSSNPSYDQYVQKFLAWERGALQQLRNLKEAAAEAAKKKLQQQQQQQQRLQPPQALGILSATPAQQGELFTSLDERLEAALRDISLADFTMAVFTMGQKDPSFLMKMFEVVERESRGTGFANPIMAQHTAASSIPHHPAHRHHLSQQTPSAVAGAALPPHPRVGYAGGAGGAGASIVGLPPPHHHHHHQRTTHHMGTIVVPVPRLPPPTIACTQMTPYGMIPEGWVVEPPIPFKLKPSASPPRPYKSAGNLPFRDFSQQ